ncbi:uncharacterized protein PV09_05652 [Verruconis gallopava]|uniref:Uncharacterized protein n=1 Tax=Verruconis gallopava TaxID=253628 RepID=A0A0D2A8B7_9PEZI|nr:uncharacterized protein PV09_05652 [Verruconis gallopava]KIW02993.1 hypothetical protein PV09_05652 [Verruconis gallopava]
MIIPFHDAATIAGFGVGCDFDAQLRKLCTTHVIVCDAALAIVFLVKRIGRNQSESRKPDDFDGLFVQSLLSKNQKIDMARPYVKVWLFGLLQVLSIVLADPSPKGGKGGGDSDSSSSSGDDSGSSSGGSGSHTGTQHVLVSGDKWPYRWPGSYYNGSMTLEVSIEYWPGCSEGQRGNIRTNMDGILLLGPANQTGTFDVVDPNFVIMGWDAGITPTNNWTDGEYWGNGGPGLTRWFSTDVKLMLSRYVEIWQDSSSTSRPYDLGWTVDSSNSGNETNEWHINGTFSGTSTTFSPRDNSEDNWMQVTTFLCNNKTTVDVLNMQPWTHSNALKDWPSTRNTTFEGTFSDSGASITWSGNYWAGFSSIDYGVPFEKTSYPQGYFTFTFDGKLDVSESDILIARNESLSGYYNSAGDPDWVKKYDRDLNAPDRTIYYGKGDRKSPPVRFVVGVALVTGTVMFLMS